MRDIKNRLKNAYQNVELCANGTWIRGPNSYHRANQELYAREMKIGEILMEETIRPRTVRDSIPQSKLARYNNYDYNESRELCYASSINEHLFHYPCTLKQGELKEPWMLPEVEQHFISLAYFPGFDLFRLMRIEELKNVENPDCEKDLHEISPLFYSTVEKTPGKPRCTNPDFVSEADIAKHAPEPLKIQSIDDMILRMKIKSDKIKKVWTETVENDLRFKKPKICLRYGNIRSFFPQHLLRINVPQARATDIKLLQHLCDSLTGLQELVASSTLEKNFGIDFPANDIETKTPKTGSPPTRRLYSAVLQGLSSKKEAVNSRTINVSSSRSVTDPSIQVPSSSQTVSSDLSYLRTSDTTGQDSENFDRLPYRNTYTDFKMHNQYPYENMYYRPPYHQYFVQNPKFLQQIYSTSPYYAHHNNSYFLIPNQNPWIPPNYLQKPYQLIQPYHASLSNQRWGTTATSNCYRHETPIKKILLSNKPIKMIANREDPMDFGNQSLSEELELEALEQYSASDENFYRELEKQAEEQYEDQSENCSSPPINIILGGLMISLFTSLCAFYMLRDAGFLRLGILELASSSPN